MTCPHCGSVLLFPDWDEPTAVDRSRRRLCSICGWTQELDNQGNPYQPAPYTPEDDSYGAASTGGRPWGNSVMAAYNLDKKPQGHSRYDGCNEVVPSCLQCPLAFCKEEDQAGFRAWQKARRRADWFPGRAVETLSSKDIPAEVARTGLHPQTISKRLSMLRLQGRGGT